MRTKVDRRRLGFGLALATVAVICLGLAAVTWSGSPTDGCAERAYSDRFILECVAEQARALEPPASTLVTSIIGMAALIAAVIVGLGAMRRVFTMADAADELGVSPRDIRTLIDQGKLQVYDREPGTIYLKPEDVRRLAATGGVRTPGTT